MNPSGLLEWVPAFVLVFARIVPTMLLFPGLGETLVPSAPRIGLALAMTILLLPDLRPLMPNLPGNGADLALMIAGEVFTGVWFGWLARQAAVILPIMAQLAAFMTGLSSILQPDPELGPQTTALSKLFELMTPLLFLTTDLYQLPLLSLRGLFDLVPLGEVLPLSDGLRSVVTITGTAFCLAVQLATPFIVVTAIWHIALGMFARLVSRMQIYFVSIPGQVLIGLLTLGIVSETILLEWHDRVHMLLLDLPGTR